MWIIAFPATQLFVFSFIDLGSDCLFVLECILFLDVVSIRLTNIIYKKYIQRVNFFLTEHLIIICIIFPIRLQVYLNYGCGNSYR